MPFDSEFLKEGDKIYNWNRSVGDQRTGREIADDIASCAQKISKYHPYGTRLAAELLTELMFLGEVMSWDIASEMRKRNAAIREEMRILRMGVKQ